MVGIVVVSHSKKVSEGVRDIIEGMVGSGKVKIECVGGESTLGVSAQEVAEAIMKVYDEEGVIVFVDFGSSITGSKAALEILPENMKQKVHITNAPLVEGAFVAAVEASLGKSLEEVIKSVKDALSIKRIL
ncbi:MAG: dihydroxyacetone kinase phosphoryl donor subunit DhaM [Desulfurococcaceae archaeon]